MKAELRVFTPIEYRFNGSIYNTPMFKVKSKQIEPQKQRRLENDRFRSYNKRILV